LAADVVTHTAQMHLRDASWFSGSVLFGLVLIAAALLVTGYGVAVGVGVIAGLLLGATSMLAVIALSSRRSGGSSYGFLSSGSRSRNWSANDPDHELIQRHGHDSMRVMGVDAGALRRVIAVGRKVEAGGAHVELTAVEIRENGGVATLVTHTPPPVGSVGPFVEVDVSDDTGGVYVASGQGSGGSGAGTSRHEIRFAPAPPDGARILILHIVRFLNPFPGPTTQLDGPWEFKVEL
jgi:hypothetical protein